MTVLSLFDGISAARVALDRAGVTVGRYYASEIKKDALTVANRMFPDTIQLGDVTKIDFSALPPIDLLVFGSPCQDLSCAGMRLGLDGKRSGLFFKAVEAIRICKPRWFLMWNASEQNAEQLAKSLLTEISTSVINRTEEYFMSAETANRSSTFLLYRHFQNPIENGQETVSLFDFYTDVFNIYPHFNMQYYADTNGNLVMLNRMADGSFSERRGLKTLPAPCAAPLSTSLLTLT